MHVRVEVDVWKAETPKEPAVEVVPRAYVVSVPQLKPSIVALAPPVDVIELEAVAADAVTLEKEGVKRVGRATGVTAFEDAEAEEVPTWFTA